MKNTTTLNENRDFRRIYKKGKTLVHPLLVTYYTKNNRGVNRLGLTATKKVGKACKRNRARRLIKEAYRLLEPTVPKGYDLVFVARAKTTTVKMNDVMAAMKGHLSKIG